jgi:hypothetical protein
MKVTADTSDCKIEIGNIGMVFAIADERGRHVGYLRVGQATVEWRRGRVRANNGKRIKLVDLLKIMDEL